MRVLVTGDKGYIGTVMVRMLIEVGHSVTGIDSDLYHRCTFGGEMPFAPSRLKDVRDVRLEDLKGFDGIIHLAALSNDPLGNLDPDLTGQINYKASVRLAGLAKQAGVKRFLFASSCSTYGAAGDGLVTEDAPLRPVTAYGESKVRVEEELIEMADSDFSPTFLRNATAYGASPRMRFDLVLNNLTAWALTTGRILIKSDGTPWRPLVHVQDICHAFICALHAPLSDVHGQAFNVGSSQENYQIRDLAEMVRQAVPGCRIEYASDGGPDKRCYRVDFSRIRRRLPNFRPRWNVVRGVRQIRDFYRGAGLKLEDFEGPRFKRIDHIRKLLEEGLLDATLRPVEQLIHPGQIKAPAPTRSRV